MTPARAKRLANAAIGKYLVDAMTRGDLEWGVDDPADRAAVELAGQSVVERIVERGRRRQADAAADDKAVAEALLDPAPIVLLPDGTRSPRLR